MGTIRFGKGNRWNASPGRVSSPPIPTMDSGTPWTHCATRTSLRPFGIRGLLPGKCGYESGILEKKKSLPHGPHGLQRKLAVDLASESACASHRLCAGATDSTESF